MKRRLSELLPYKASDKIRNEIQRGLYEYELLISKALSAFTHYENEEFINFDGLVGENGCQTRAIKIALLASNKKIDIECFRQRIVNVLNKVDALLLESNDNIKKMGQNLQDLFDQEELELWLTDDEFFLIKAHILTITKEYHPKMEIFYGKDGSFYPLKKARSISKKIIKPNTNISNRFADNVSNQTKKLLSESSVRFVQEAAEEINDPMTLKMVSDEFTYIHNSHLSCSPLFWSMKSLFLTAQKEELPILLHAKFLVKEGEELKEVDEEYLYIKQISSGERIYLELDEVDEELKQACCVVQGVVCEQPNQAILSKDKWKEIIKQHNFMDILLSNCSVHGQYPNEKQDEVIESLQITEFENLKKFGDEHGFTSNNPSTFLVQHIYAAIPEKVISP